MCTDRRDDHLDRQIDDLFYRYRWLIHRIASQMEDQYYDREEVEQIGRIAIWQTLEVLERKPGYAFGTVFGLRFRQCLRDWYRQISGPVVLTANKYERWQWRRANIHSSFSLDALLPDEDDPDVTLKDTLPDDSNELHRLEREMVAGQFWDAIRSLLSPLHYQVLELKFRGRDEPLDSATVGKMMGIKENYVNSIVWKAIDTIRNRLKSRPDLAELMRDVLSDPPAVDWYFGHRHIDLENVYPWPHLGAEPANKR